jgi:hypothetical protein
MTNTSNFDAKLPHFKRFGAVGLQFSPEAVEIVLLDRRGQVIWEKKRMEPMQPIQWDGVDLNGDPVTVGSYVCKITYPGQAPLYLPFVFIR